MKLVRKEKEVLDLIDECIFSESKGTSLYPGMSYEQGIKIAIEWIVGLSEDHPLRD